ncbi:MAG: TatD family hydrolase [Deltaproteobacteria bacterium]|nr:TatD family hydrolase [Deltaproteobacteria bacterium]
MSKKKHCEPRIDPASLDMPLTGTDSHAHLDLRHFSDDEVDSVLARAEAAGVATIGNVFLSAAAWETGRERFRNHPGVFFILGVHPTDATDYTPGEREAMICAFAADERLRAVGEIGLDFYWKDCPPDVQIPAFIDQLRLARDLNKPVVIHSRDAHEQTLAILRDEGFHGYPLLWHCFGGTRDQAQYLVDAGWHISVPGPVTYPANAALRDALSVIPPDRLLAETDCPYLTPMPYRGKRNEPAYTVFTVHAMAEALGLPAADLWTRCGENARRFFGVALPRKQYPSDR